MTAQALADKLNGNFGAFPISEDDLPAALRRRLAENWMYPAPKGVDIRYSSLGGKAVAYGAAGMIFDRLVTERLLPGLGVDQAIAAGA